MKRNFLLLTFIVVSYILVGCGSRTTYLTLEEVVKNNFSTQEITILNVYNEKNLVLCLNNGQYILGGYSLRDGLYENFKTHSKLNTVDYSDIVIQTEYIKDVGNIIWGTIDSKENVEKFIIEYLNGEIEEVLATNNTFISRMPETLQKINPNLLGTRVLNVYAINKSNKVLGELKIYNVADPLIVIAY